MIITSHMQNIIQIYPCLLKLSRKQDKILKIGDFSTKNYDFPPKPLLQIFPCKNTSKIMIITSHMQKIIQIHPCLLKLSRQQESVTDGRTDRRTAAITISFI
jgi:hypothetical protein